MNKVKQLSYKNIIAVTFCGFIFICGILTVTVNFKEVLGGFVRGYINAPKESKITTKLTNSVRTFDDRMNEYYILHSFSLDFYGGIQKVLDKHLIDDADPENNVVKLNNGYLTFMSKENKDGSVLKEYLLELNNVCDSTGTDLVYVKKLAKSTYDWDKLPAFFPYRYTSDFSDTIVDLKNSGIGVLDLDEVVRNEGIDKYSLFYKTDHHWKTTTGLWVSKKIAWYLNEYYNMKIDVSKLDINNYVVETHNNAFLGTQGVRTGSWYITYDDFDFIYPNYPTNIDYTVNNKGIDLSGSFLETILLNKTYKEGYGAYMPATYDLTIIKNHEANNGNYAVCVVDSMGSTVAPFLSQTFERVDCIDLRYYSEDLSEYIVQNKPDIVIYMVDWTDAVLHQDVI